ncbi:hypothetical protein YC2023_035437 [Brassica napus]
MASLDTIVGWHAGGRPNSKGFQTIPYVVALASAMIYYASKTNEVLKLTYNASSVVFQMVDIISMLNV